MGTWKRSRSPMHLTRAGDHAIRALLVLLRQSANGRLTSYRLAEETKIPAEFLRKILSALARAKILRSVRGPTGGVRLARKPEDITLLDIVEAVEGPLALNECTRAPSACPRSPHCLVHPVWQQAQERLRETLASATLATFRNGTPRG
jgi:Rrf2 family iron-sulfur cluster assembly transcriptional regulator